MWALFQYYDAYTPLRDAPRPSPPHLQVIATFLQFDEAEIVQLQAVRQQKAAAQAGLLGQAASLFLIGGT